MAGKLQLCNPLCQRDIPHEENLLAMGRGVLTDKILMRVSSLSEK